MSIHASAAALSQFGLALVAYSQSFFFRVCTVYTYIKKSCFCYESVRTHTIENKEQVSHPHHHTHTQILETIRLDARTETVWASVVVL